MGVDWRLREQGHAGDFSGSARCNIPTANVVGLEKTFICATMFIASRDQDDLRMLLELTRVIVSPYFCAAPKFIFSSILHN